MASQPITSQIADILADHEPWKTWGLTDEGIYCGGCEQRYVAFTVHTAAEVVKALALEELNEKLQAVTELHKPGEWLNCINACCSGEDCRHRSRYCITCDMDSGDYPCPTARILGVE